MSVIAPVKKLLIYGAESPKFKYSLIISAIGAVHVCLVILFCLLRVFPLVLLNIGSVMLYAGCLLAIRRDRDARKKRRYVIATLLGLIAFAAFVSFRVLSMYFGTIYQLDIPEWVELGVYIFNTFCNFAFLFMVTVIFLVEMQTATNQLQRQNAILDQMASIDPLTGLYNRRSMHSFLNHAMESEEKTSFCLVMCDIDDFKKINDTYGHDAGDTVLKGIARIAQEQVNQHGQACRWGGEEMLLIINGDLEEVLRTRMAAP